ncbi:TonB-linked outer membrane protein, SusC/RagA family [Chitinophaga terrae (ex Kim and Jung 2007)]|uniref:TonB-linked outer membrane protein, SusC/RagA family n=1 Tax=Chitinophaga terrae (ex Kim and Jung 2007) TaxID=408074 RepID=A0A1H4DIV3_9BACT|nr:TonB-dependent receptor [Chitinophaga terrae (ex Kim and Jung 2007)]GEP92739.1 SusC/RagA family TonB-linked outer membrane protein [Chitinophaga terrae (ex Kim and Jung 2007)]SEA72350.1 TonB-linked outer membrane protein, SusC/RagA family [Chitinophaga terrae (ex Kim and Jung 2007)]
MKRKFTSSDQFIPAPGVTTARIKRLGLLGGALLLSTSLFARQNSLNEKVKLDISSASLSQVLTALGAQSSFTFSYVKQDFDRIIVKDFKPNNITLSEALQMLRSKSGIEYSVNEKAILLRKAEQDETPAPQQVVTKKISGRVVSDEQEPIPGVSVWVKGTQIRTVTDMNGKFTINVPDEKSVISFSYVGFTTVDVTAGNQETLNITLKHGSSDLDAVVVLGYGTAKKGDLSAAVSTISDMKTLKERPVTDLSNMLQGRIPGVTVVSNGGHPTNSNNMVIRGVGSPSGGSVMYVVDGVPNAPYNPADVESITVLKDAASAAIYGAFAGSSGVVLVTTRQATKGDPYVQYQGFTGVKQAWRTLQSLDASQQAMVANLADKNAGNPPQDGWDITKNPYAQVTRTDWMKEIFRTAPVQRHVVTLNAGSEKLTALFQGRYENEEGTLLNTFNKNLSLRLNVNYQFTKNIKFKQDIFWNNNENRDAETASGYSGVILSAIYMPRSATVYYDDGSFGGVGPRNSDYNGIHGDALNPVALLLRNKATNKSNDLQSISEFSYSNLVPGLSYVSRFSYRQINSYYKKFTPKITEPGKPNDMNFLSYADGNIYHWIWENTLNYTRTFNRHSLGLMASITSQERGDKGFTAGARGFENEADWAQYFTNALDFSKDIPTDYNNVDRNASYVGRASYSWADRYFVTGSYRYDIAGRLAPGYRAHSFPGVTAAWKISSEPFFHLDFVDLLKIRGSWGKVGSIETVPLYYGYQTLTPGYTYQIGANSPRSNSLSLSGAINPQLSWESSQQTDVGLDISLFKQKLLLTVDYFDKKTFDLIYRQTSGWPNTFGLSAPLINQGKIGNTGWEFSATYANKIGQVGYNLNANFATLKNRVLEIDNNPNSVMQFGDAFRGILVPFRSKVGEPLFSYWLIKTDGIFQSDAEAKAYQKDGKPIQPNAKAGDLKFVDESGDGKIDDDDRVYMGNAAPKVTYGFSASVTWKNFDLSVFMQGVGGVKLFNAFKMTTLSGSEQGYNRWNKILDAWSPENTGSNIPQIRANDPNKNFGTNSDWYLEKGDYLRLKNLLIGYTFPKMRWNKGLRVYVSGDNLLTFTKYSGMDPEVGGIGLDGGQFPISRAYSIGVNVKF